MYMEAYGQVGSWADSVMKKSIEAVMTRKIAKEDAKEVLPKQEVSPSVGGSPMATPQANQPVEQPQADVNSEMMAKDKAIDSLNKKVANWRAKAEYRNSLVKLQQRELNKYKKKEMVGVK